MSPEDPPDWLTEPCPEWCMGDHTEQEFEADRMHTSPSVFVPGVTLLHGHRPHDAEDMRDLTDAIVELPTGERVGGITLTVALHRKIGSPLTWVYIGDGGSEGLELSHETVRLLLEATKQLLSNTSKG